MGSKVVYHNYDIWDDCLLFPIHQKSDEYTNRIQFTEFNYKDSYTCYSVFTDAKILTEWLYDDLELVVTEAEVTKALAEEHTRMMKSCSAKKLAYIIAYGYERGIDMRDIRKKLIGTSHKNFMKINEIISDLESKLW